MAVVLLVMFVLLVLIEPSKVLPEALMAVVFTTTAAAFVAPVAAMLVLLVLIEPSKVLPEALIAVVFTTMAAAFVAPVAAMTPTANPDIATPLAELASISVVRLAPEALMAVVLLVIFVLLVLIEPSKVLPEALMAVVFTTMAAAFVAPVAAITPTANPDIATPLAELV